MDFNLSKENIQPLRGGRNVSQLGVALQAQTNTELQREMMQRKEEYENLIKNYNGPDPLENWFNFISWVEQSYPKNGHEGHLVPLLETCLRKFENELQYKNDERFCKLWIKYIDFQQNPLELYHMMHARGLCRGCADLYKAWAYYHEAAGDYQNANNVFECGKRELAQPYDELETAQKNLCMAAGQHVITGVADERRLQEKRQALTTLNSHRKGRISSIRQPNNNIPTNFPNTLPTSSKSNVLIPIYEDRGDEMPTIEAPPISIITVAKRQEMPKENTLKPGPWTTVPIKKRLTTQRSTPNFIVPEDDDNNVVNNNENNEIPQLIFPKCTLEDFTEFKVNLRVPEPKDPKILPIYPKEKVYSKLKTEFSLEELRAFRYFGKTDYLNDNEEEGEEEEDEDKAEEQVDGNKVFQNNKESLPKLEQPLNIPLCEEPLQTPSPPPLSLQLPPLLTPQLPLQMQQQQPHQLNPQLSPPQLQPQVPISLPLKIEPKVVNNFPIYMDSPCGSPMQLGNVEGATGGGFQSKFSIYEQSPIINDKTINLNKFECDIWDNSPLNKSDEILMLPKNNNNLSKFAIYEQSNICIQENIEPKGSAMKTPFKDLNAEELAETGSRGGMDIAAAAPVSAKRLPLFDYDNDNDDDDDNNSLLMDNKYNIDDDPNTQTFNFNLNAMKVSTPNNKEQQQQITTTTNLETKASKKQLFTTYKPEEKVLSIIFEESKSHGSSSNSSSGATTKSTIFGQTKQNNNNNMATISEEHNSYLAQNMMANAALRRTLLGDLMDFEVSTNEKNELSPKKSLTDNCTLISPLKYIPSDPFTSNLIAELLEKVQFPGPHTKNYYQLYSLPKLIVRTDSISIGHDRYVIERQLGKGNYGTVFRGTDVKTGRTVALKHQKSTNNQWAKWEFYICRELRARLADHPLMERFMDIKVAYFGEQGSILVSDFMPCGSLLDVSNAIKQKSGRSMKESLCIYFCLEMLKVVQAMHNVKIIHADIKPDNFLVKLSLNGEITLKLIDFGCSIDMTLFPPDASFTRIVNTENFICCEMLDQRRWNYHTDLFCVAATAHVLLFEKYLQLQRNDGHWSIQQRIPRYLRIDLWNMFFSTLLNQQCGPADSNKLQKLLEDNLKMRNVEYHSEMRTLLNILKNR